MSLKYRNFASFAYYSLVSLIYNWTISLDESYRGIRADFMSAMDILSGSDVIECGCGPGTNVRYYPDDVCLHMIDSNPLMIWNARLRYSDDIDFRVADACKLPYSDDSMDCGVLTYALSAIESNKDVLPEMTRVVREDGKIGILDFDRGIPSYPSFASVFDLNDLLEKCDGVDILLEEHYERHKRGSLEILPQSIYILEVL